MQPTSPTKPPIDLDYLAEVLIDRELPVVVRSDAAIDLTIVDLTDPLPGQPIDQTAEASDRTGGGWSLADDTAIGRVVTPDHVLGARARHHCVVDGRPLDDSGGTAYQTTPSFAGDYVANNILSASLTETATGTVSVEDARRRLVHFLELTDDDFAACFRFDGRITGEYLLQVSRCEHGRLNDEASQRRRELSPKERRTRKAESLRTT